MSNEVNIIYIGGYGRSGSTLLERIIASSDKIIGIGEFLKYKKLTIEGNLCSCGSRFSDCEFWSHIIDDNSISQESLMARLINYGKEKDISYLIDSSKTTRMSIKKPLMWKKNTEVKFIHLVRNGVSCMNSNLSFNLRPMSQREEKIVYKFPFFRTLFSWSFSNYISELYKLSLGKRNYLRVRYEDLISDPISVIRRLEEFLNLDLKDTILMLQNNNPIPLTHQLDGNRIKTKDPLYLNKNILGTVDEKKSSMENKMFKAVNFHLLNRYKY